MFHPIVNDSIQEGCEIWGYRALGCRIHITIVYLDQFRRYWLGRILNGCKILCVIDLTASVWYMIVADQGCWGSRMWLDPCRCHGWSLRAQYHNWPSCRWCYPTSDRLATWCSLGTWLSPPPTCFVLSTSWFQMWSVVAHISIKLFLLT